MGMIDDVLKALDRIPLWKRLREVPAEVDELKRRVAALEEKLGDTWPADVCRYCGKRASRLSWSGRPNEKGVYREEWTCGECGEVESRPLKAR